MNHPIFLIHTMLLFFMGGAIANAGQTTLTTYYPAPAGNYDQLRLVPHAPGSDLSNPCVIGTLYVDSAQTLRYCGNGAAWGTVGAWTQTGNNIYPANTASNPNINVGIGNITPVYKLDVSGNARLNNVFLGDMGFGSLWAGFAHSNSATMAGYGLLQSNDGAFTLINKKSGGGYIGFRVDNADKMTIADNGLVTINNDATVGGSVTASGFFYSSDSRLKKDIRPIAHALDKVRHLNGITFTWKNNNVKSMGLTAQNVEKILPELVAADTNGVKSVAYGNLVALLIESVKEQQEQIKEQQKQIDGLRSQLKQIKR